MSSKTITRAMTAGDLPVISKLHERVFGPGRFARSAYRVREGRSGAVSPFCRVALLGERIVASLHLTDVTIGGVGGALLLGPIAVDPDHTGQGYGRRIIGEALAEAKERGERLVLLVGDEPYYGRLGFNPVPPGQIGLPGPVNPLRLLAAELEPGILAVYRGLVTAV